MLVSTECERKLEGSDDVKGNWIREMGYKATNMRTLRGREDNTKWEFQFMEIILNNISNFTSFY